MRPAAVRTVRCGPRGPRLIVERIDLDQLASLIGGSGSTAATTFPLGSVVTDEQRLQELHHDRVQQQTAAQYPSTRSWWNPFSTDTNAANRGGAATMKNMVSTCGFPPS